LFNDDSLKETKKSTINLKLGEKQGIYAYELALKGRSPIYEMHCIITNIE
jgi:hypothetical protein